MNLISISAFQDNYIWVLVDDDRRCIIVDPGESVPILHAIEENDWQPEAILLTHHHHDHVDGVPDLLARYPHIPVYDQQRHRIRVRRKLSKKAKVSSYSGASFPYLLRQVTLPVISVSTANLIFFVATRCFPAAVEGCLKARQNRCINLYKKLMLCQPTP